MTRLLPDAIDEAGKWSDAEQDAIATLILDQIADDDAWDEAFAGSRNQLGRLAEKVRAEIEAGRVRASSHLAS